MDVIVFKLDQESHTNETEKAIDCEDFIDATTVPANNTGAPRCDHARTRVDYHATDGPDGVRSLWTTEPLAKVVKRIRNAKPVHSGGK